DLDESAYDFLAEVGYDPAYGARPVKRAIQRYLLNDLSKALLSNKVSKSQVIHVQRDGDKLTFS
ncbi:MAG: hypothetical protein WCR36_09880, partial [Bacteroidaceae bacterium]